MLNRYCFHGNLGRDAEVRTLDNGTSAISFTVAITEKWKDKQGQTQEKTTWVNCTKWVMPGGSTAIAGYLKKGTKVYVEGKPEARPYVTKDSQAAASLEVRVESVDLMGSAPAGQQSQGGSGWASPTAAQQSVAQRVQAAAVPAYSNVPAGDDDLPF